MRGPTRPLRSKVVNHLHHPGDNLPFDEPARAVEDGKGLDAGVERLLISRIHQLLCLMLSIFCDGSRGLPRQFLLISLKRRCFTAPPTPYWVLPEEGV